MRPLRFPLALSLAALLAACAGVDNSPQPTPLSDIAAKTTLRTAWKASFGPGQLYRFAPDIDGEAVYMASASQGFAGFAKADGRKLAEFRAERPLAGGISASRGTVVAGTLKGEVLAYEPSGRLKWRAQVSSEVVSPPVSAEGAVVVRSVDGRVWALELEDGKVRWQFQRSQPALVLRNYAPVTIADGVVFVGMAGGKLAAVSLRDGRLLWESVVAPPRGATELERVTDISSAPAVEGSEVCAVAFQGRVACFNVSNGQQLWAREVSSYAGLAMDKKQVYVSDETGNVMAFERSGGRTLWKQDKLYGRRLSAPAVYQGLVAVGDFEGVVHLLDPADGSFRARQTTDKSRILVAPRLVDDKLLVQTEAGGLFAFVSP
ncbi:outer membrane protein assembly factor BamB [Chitinimonas lacunae]|uniref:Outer membrane protein assembly factor BamB n=1 Tax=Chitinimonas lacunae TaxID=1963018 RepID=A0ABV8MQ19_9NEIS